MVRLSGRVCQLLERKITLTGDFSYSSPDHDASKASPARCLAAFEPVVARAGLLRLAFKAYDTNDLLVAKDRFEKALQVDPNYPQAYYYLGVINAAKGAMAEAKREIERFLQLAPKDPEANSARDMLKYLIKP